MLLFSFQQEQNLSLHHQSAEFLLSSSHHVPQWHYGYLKSKLFGKPLMQRYPPLSPWNQDIISHMKNTLLVPRREKTSLSPGRNFNAKKAIETNLVTVLSFYYLAPSTAQVLTPGSPQLAPLTSGNAHPVAFLQDHKRVSFLNPFGLSWWWSPAPWCSQTPLSSSALTCFHSLWYSILIRHTFAHLLFTL